MASKNKIVKKRGGLFKSLSKGIVVLTIILVVFIVIGIVLYIFQDGVISVTKNVLGFFGLY